MIRYCCLLAVVTLVSCLVLSESQLCTYCPPEAKTCSEGNEVTLKPGYWRITDEATYIHSCLGKYSCGGGNVTGDASCRQGYVGPLCGICDEDYFQATDGLCIGCSHPYFVSMCVAGSLMVLVIYGFVPLVWVLRVTLKRSCSEENLRRLSLINIMVSMYSFVFTSKRDDHAFTAGDIEVGVSRLVEGLLSRLLAKCKIFLSLFQMASLLPLVLDLRYADHGAYSRHLARVSRFTVLNGGLATECYTSFDYVDLLIITAAVPLLGSVVLLNVHRLHQLYVTSFFPALRRMTSLLDKLQSEYLWVFLQCLFVVHPCVLTAIFRAFPCVDVDPANELGLPDRESSFLRADLSLSCGSERYRRGKFIGVGMAIVYGLGVPLLYWQVLRTRPQRLGSCTDKYRTTLRMSMSLGSSGEGGVHRSRSSTTINAMKGGGHFSGVLSLCDAYKPEYCAPVIVSSNSRCAVYVVLHRFWDIVDCIKKIFFCGLLAVVYPGTSLQLFIAVAAALVFLKLHSFCQPYADDVLNTDADFANYQLLAILLLTLVIRADISSERDDFVSSCLTVALFSCFLLSLGRFLRDWVFGIRAELLLLREDSFVACGNEDQKEDNYRTPEKSAGCVDARTSSKKIFPVESVHGGNDKTPPAGDLELAAGADSASAHTPRHQSP